MALSEIQILRLEHGDTDLEYPVLTDEEYQYYIDNFPNKKKRDRMITLAYGAQLVGDVRERSGQEERYGNQHFQNWKEFIKVKHKDLAFTGGANTPLSVGGVFKDEMAALATDPNRVPDTFVKGEYRGFAEWQTTRHYYYCGMIQPYNNLQCLYYPFVILI